MAEVTGVTDPDGARARAIQLSVMGEEYHGRVAPKIDQIDSDEDGAPWGNDSYGQEFLKNYNDTDGNGKVMSGGGLAGQTKQGTLQWGLQTKQMGDATSKGVTDEQVADLRTAADIKTTGGDTPA